MGERSIRQSDVLSNIYGDRIVSGEDPTPPQGDAEIPSHVLLKDQVEAKLTSMTLEERRVVKLRFGLEDGRSRTFADIAKEIGKSPTTARRRLNSALPKLR